MQKYIIIILLILITISCGKKDPVSNSVFNPTRQLNDFDDAIRIFPESDVGDECYDSDIAVIQQGPGLSVVTWGTVWAPVGTSWSVAVALSEYGASQNGYRQVRFRFLSSDGELSDEYPVPLSIGIIRLARVDACYFYTNDLLGTDTTYVEVSIVYQRWYEDVPGEDDMWKINVHRLIFDPAVIISEDWENLEIIENYHHQEEFEDVVPVNGQGQMMPDIAYDPRSKVFGYHGKGDIYVVFTWYDGIGPHVYYRVGYRRGDKHAMDHEGFQEFSSEQLIQDLTGPMGLYHGFHPRIDIGKVEFFPDLPFAAKDWYAVVAFTADKGFFEPHMSFWKAGWNGSGQLNPLRAQFPIKLPPYAAHAGFMPTVDIGVPDTNHCAITWTQARSASWNDVTVGYIDTHFGFGFLESDDPMESFAFPSVAVWEVSPEPGPQEDPFIRTSLSYLQTDNPNSVRWSARARSMDTILSDPPEMTIGDDVFLLGEDFPGDYDSGSQYTNWYGMSTSMIVDDGSYWVLWSAVGDLITNNLTQVCGAYGYTED